MSGYVVNWHMGAEDWLPELRAVCDASVCSDPDVEFVVAFGSQVTGEAVQSSDIDVAVKFADHVSERDRFERQCFLSGSIQREHIPFVDLSDIETLPLDVAHDAVAGTLVCGDERAFEQFETEIEAAFAERRDSLRRRQREVIDRIAEEGLRN